MRMYSLVRALHIMLAACNTWTVGMRAHHVELTPYWAQPQKKLIRTILGVVTLSSESEGPCRDTLARYPHDLCCDSWVRATDTA